MRNTGKVKERMRIGLILTAFLLLSACRKPEANAEVPQPEDIVIDRMYFGSFSQKNADEVFVVCKILNTPHVGGLDRTIGMLLDADSMEIVAYKDFPYDQVVLNRVKSANGLSRIVLIGTSTSQGISAQDVELYAVQNGKLEALPLEIQSMLGENRFCYPAEDILFITSEAVITEPAQILEVWGWNPETEQFQKAE